MTSENLLKIQDIVTHVCPKCGSLDMVKNGRDYKGAQKYHCKTCDSYGTLNGQRRYSQAVRAQIRRVLLERVSLRGIETHFPQLSPHRQALVSPADRPSARDRDHLGACAMG